MKNNRGKIEYLKYKNFNIVIVLMRTSVMKIVMFV